MVSILSSFLNTSRRAIQATAVYVVIIFSTFALSPNLHAQDTTDLPDAPEPQPGNGVSASARSGSRSEPDPLTFRERLRIYERSFARPESMLGPLFGAAVGQARNNPPEWGQGSEGFGQRLASGYGRAVIAKTIGFGISSLDGEDTRYVPSRETGIWRRGWYATTRTFVSRTPSGGYMPAYSRFAGVYGAAFIANYWEPPSQADTPHALQRGSTAIASSVGWHIFEEFWPDIRKKIVR